MVLDFRTLLEKSEKRVDGLRARAHLKWTSCTKNDGFGERKCSLTGYIRADYQKIVKACNNAAITAKEKNSTILQTKTVVRPTATVPSLRTNVEALPFEKGILRKSQNDVEFMRDGGQS